MTNEEKKLIDGLRAEGLGYRKIAVRIGISENTVKSYLRKVETSETKDITPAPTAGDSGEPHSCLYCGKPVAQNPGRKQKKFCSDACRNQWWNNHQDLVRPFPFWTIWTSIPCSETCWTTPWKAWKS